MSSQKIDAPGTMDPVHGFFPPPGLYPGEDWRVKYVYARKKGGYYIQFKRNDETMVNIAPGSPKDATAEYLFRRFYAITNFCMYHENADSVQIKHLLMDSGIEDLLPMGMAKTKWVSARHGEELLRSPAYFAVALVQHAENVLGGLNNNQQIPLHERIVAALTGAVWSMFTFLFQSASARQVDAIMNPEGTYDEVIETVGATMSSTVGGFDFGLFEINEPDGYTKSDCILYVGTADSSSYSSPRLLVSHSSVKSLAVHTLFSNMKRDQITLAEENKGMVVDIIKDILATQDYMWVLKHDDEASVWTMNKLTTNNFHTEMKREGVFYNVYLFC
jgi:hypothetical protein